VELVIGNFNYSTWSMRPWLFVHKHKLPVSITRYDFGSDELSETLSMLFSNRKIPVLVNGGDQV